MNNKKMTLKGEARLHELLMDTLTKDLLQLNCKVFSVPYRSNWNKSRLSLVLEEKWLSNPKLLLYRLPMSALELLQKLVHAGGNLTVTSYDIERFLFDRGVAGLVSGSLSAPSRIYISANLCSALKPVIDSIVSDRELWIQDKRDIFLAGLIRLFGALPLSELVESYNEMTGEEITLDLLVEAVLTRDRLFWYSSFFGFQRTPWVCTTEVYNPESLANERTRRTDLKNYRFSEKMILYAGAHFLPFSSRASEKLIDYLRKAGLIEQGISLLLDRIWQLSQNDAPMAEILDAFQPFLPMGNIEELNRRMTLVVDYINSMPRWTLKGHSAEQLFRKERPFLQPLPSEPFRMSGDFLEGRTPPSAKEPGRNDPCPCGSGKKYKFCCGNIIPLHSLN